MPEQIFKMFMCWKEAKISFIRKGNLFYKWRFANFGIFSFFLVFLIILNHVRYSLDSELCQAIDYHLLISDLCKV